MRSIEDVRKEESIIKDGMTTAELVEKTKKYIVQPPLVLNLMYDKPPKIEEEESIEDYEKRLEGHETDSEIFARIMNEVSSEKIKIIHEKHKWVASARMTAYLVCLIYAKCEFVDAEEEEKGVGRVRELLDSSPAGNVASIEAEEEKENLDNEIALLLTVIRKVSLQQREIIMKTVEESDPEKAKTLRKILEEEKVSLTHDQRELGDGEVDPDDKETFKTNIEEDQE